MKTRLLLLICAVLLPLSVFAGDAAMPKYSSGNENQVQIPLPTIEQDLNAVSISSVATVYTPTSGKKYRLIGGTISVSVAMSVLFENNAASGTKMFRTPKLAADTPYTFVVLGGQGKLSPTVDHVLKATGSASGTITGTLDFAEE